MRKTLRKRKAVSPVIASLLMIAIAVATSIILYGWAQSMVGSTAKQAQTSIRIDEVEFTDDKHITVSVRNTGSVPAIIKTAYVYDGDTQILMYNGPADEGINCVLQPGALDDITDLTGFTTTTLDVTHAYLIRLVTDNGFSVEGTYYTPSVLDAGT